MGKTKNDETDEVQHAINIQTYTHRPPATLTRGTIINTIILIFCNEITELYLDKTTVNEYRLRNSYRLANDPYNWKKWMKIDYDLYDDEQVLLETAKMILNQTNLKKRDAELAYLNYVARNAYQDENGKLTIIINLNRNKIQSVSPTMIKMILRKTGLHWAKEKIKEKQQQETDISDADNSLIKINKHNPIEMENTML
jgi:hypothetical protein